MYGPIEDGRSFNFSRGVAHQLSRRRRRPFVRFSFAMQSEEAAFVVVCGAV
jgi:hypothetical protein